MKAIDRALIKWQLGWTRSAANIYRAPEARRGLLVSLGLDDFLAAVISAGADVMAQMNLATDRLHRKGRLGKKRVRSMHAAL